MINPHRWQLARESGTMCSSLRIGRKPYSSISLKIVDHHHCLATQHAYLKEEAEQFFRILER